MLEDDPQCGLTTGGKEECIWDCEAINFETSSTVSSVQTGVTFKNALCLEDCFEEDHCITMLFNDYKKEGGVCDGVALIEGVEDYTFAPEGTCNVTIQINQGVCSPETEVALLDPRCIYDAGSRDPTFWQTLVRLISLTCRPEVSDKWRDASQWLFQGRPQQAKLNPIYGVIQHPELGEIGRWVPNFENTKNRYPWICSLRSKHQSKTHFCAATLLKRPPGPIVMVTTAHCTFLCKSEDGNIRSNCCCQNVRKVLIKAGWSLMKPHKQKCTQVQF